ncbi:MAG: DUF5117 domain-containing protein, partial [Flavobacteriales bacterium]|nr:DUF5117 domain-containing protein [Flavobacteriales bacterium]
MNRMIKIAFVGLALLGTATLSPAVAQKKSKKKKGGSEMPAKKKDGKSFADITKKCVKFEGLFTIYQDTTTGKSYVEVKEDQVGKEFIYFSYIADGLLDAGFFRGSYRGSKVISFNKHYEKLEIIAENTGYYFDEDNALSRASGANINRPVIISQKVEATNKETGAMLIDGDAIFLSEKFQMIKPPSRPGSKSMLGGLSKDKTKIKKINNYPENSEIQVTYVYENKNPQVGGSKAATDVRNIAITYQHSLLEMPENNYQARRDDPR